MIMKSKKNWYDKYNYDLMDKEYDRRMRENINFSVEENLESIQFWIDQWTKAKEQFLDYEEKDLAFLLKTKPFWECYLRENTIRRILRHKETFI